jgi:hypothetical protein
MYSALFRLERSSRLGQTETEIAPQKPRTESCPAHGQFKVSEPKEDYGKTPKETEDENTASTIFARPQSM